MFGVLDNQECNFRIAAVHPAVIEVHCHLFKLHLLTRQNHGLKTDITPYSGLATRTLAGSALRMPTAHALSSAAKLCQHSWPSQPTSVASPLRLVKTNPGSATVGPAAHRPYDPKLCARSAPFGWALCLAHFSSAFEVVCTKACGGPLDCRTQRSVV